MSNQRRPFVSKPSNPSRDEKTAESRAYLEMATSRASSSAMQNAYVGYEVIRTPRLEENIEPGRPNSSRPSAFAASAVLNDARWHAGLLQRTSPRKEPLITWFPLGKAHFMGCTYYGSSDSTSSPEAMNDRSIGLISTDNNDVCNLRSKMISSAGIQRAPSLQPDRILEPRPKPQRSQTLLVI